MVALVDYGAGNLHSVENALKRVGAQVSLVSDGDALARAERIVLPGVGSFRACAEGLRAEAGVIDAMRERVFVGGAPFLGICVGMQLLATRGLEHGETPGLVDICIVPQVFNAERYECDLSAYPRLISIFAECMKLEAFDSAQPSKQPN